MPEQLTFDLPAHPAQGLDDFLVTPSNANAMATIESWQNWPNRKLVLAGEAGTGKTHLTHVWAGLSGAQILHASALPQIRIEDLAGQSVALEDADQIAGNAEAENALFHLHNLVLAEGGALLVTARSAPSRWGLTLPDLRSRMEGTTLARLDPPDDMLLSAVLVKLFHDRQITVPANLIDYLLPRMERSLAEAARLVSVLDQAALSEGRALTRTLAVRVLDKDPENEA
ncbi:DnaA ATPase domain-containing protein [Aliiroseovarius sp. PrR006]|uniref:DnaA ATPase domain-containing protein n=1 Tax=Aliiroseovarius sp. PrR006 TaxID=2706883 RepID=UPI0013D82CDE|nr:DnaA/Hda family protein [Aliiroseovarius sp. PrR006]NDW52831.1 chromosomal replication initiator DnaA [Aliiroseovarius sp. PrR006]